MENENHDTGLDGDVASGGANPVPPSGAAKPTLDEDLEQLTPPPQRIEIGFIQGDVTIIGGASQVSLRVPGDGRSHDEELRVDDDKVLRLATLPSRSELHVPHDVEVVVREINGNLRCEQLKGLLQVNRVEGDVSLDTVSMAELTGIGGDLRAASMGELHVREVEGNVQLADMQKMPVLGQVQGDLEAHDLAGLEVRKGVGGDVLLERCGSIILYGPVGGELRAKQCGAVRGSTLSRSALLVDVGDVTLSNVGLELAIKNAGSVEVRNVGVSLDLYTVKDISIGSVGANLAIRGVDGKVDIRRVGGNAQVVHVSGPVSIEKVGGNVYVADAPAGVFAEAGGNATLDTSLGARAEYVVQAAANVTLRTRGEINARFVAQTAKGEIHTQLPLTVERGRRRNLVGVIGRGDTTVTLRSKYSNINILAANGDEKEYNMSNDFGGRTSESENKEQARTEEGSRVWEGGFGRRRFRAQWERGPKGARFSFQGPFSANDDPDGMGRAFEPDFGFEWERGRGGRTYGEYGDRLDDVRERAERVARRATERARRYAERATQRMREVNWDEVEREVRSTVEKAMKNLEETFTELRSEWNKRQQLREQAQASKSAKKGEPSKGQRVRIEYDDEGEPLSDDVAMGQPSAAGQTSSAFSPEERSAQRRAILEQLRTGAISLEEAERQLSKLG